MMGYIIASVYINIVYTILVSGEIFENMLQLKRFGIYFEGILNRKWLLSYRNNDISYRDAMGLGDMLPKKIFK